MHCREECAHAETSIEVLRDSVLLQGPACLNDIATTAVASSCSTDGASSDCIQRCHWHLSSWSASAEDR